MHDRFHSPSELFDIGLSVTSGQAFRWKQDGASWVGMVDHSLIILKREGDEVTYDTFPQPNNLSLIKSYFNLDLDTNALHETLLRLDSTLYHKLQKFKGLRVLRWTNPEECLLSFICTSNNNIPRIKSMINTLCEEFGDILTERGGIIYKGFPNAKTLSRVDERFLREKGFGYRAKSIINASLFITQQDENWLESLKSVPYEDAKQELMRLPGVGPKIADCVCLFGLHHYEAVPVDTHLWQAVCAWCMPELAGKPLTDARYKIASDYFRERFGSLAGWAHQYLFYAHLTGER